MPIAKKNAKAKCITKIGAVARCTTYLAVYAAHLSADQ